MTSNEQLTTGEWLSAILVKTGLNFQAAAVYKYKTAAKK
jgi:hypothetical protein